MPSQRFRLFLTDFHHADVDSIALTQKTVLNAFILFCLQNRALQTRKPLLARLRVKPDGNHNNYSKKRCECYYCINHNLVCFKNSTGC